MYIGEASKRTGLSIKAIRFYEEKGLIRQPERIGRYRVLLFDSMGSSHQAVKDNNS